MIKNNNKKDNELKARNEDDECSIGFESIINKELFVCYCCKNGFHNNCIEQVKRYNNKCPLCRSVLNIDKTEENDIEVLNLMNKIKNM